MIVNTPTRFNVFPKSGEDVASGLEGEEVQVNHYDGGRHDPDDQGSTCGGIPLSCRRSPGSLYSVREELGAERTDHYLHHHNSSPCQRAASTRGKQQL